VEVLLVVLLIPFTKHSRS